MIASGVEVHPTELQGLIETQSVQIEFLKAQIAAFRALADTIQSDRPPMPATIEVVLR